MAKKVVVCDLDSTLCDTQQRHHLIATDDPDEKTDWTAYSMACSEDTPFQGTVSLLRLMKSAGHKVVLVSGRSDKARDLTVEWLRKHNVRYDALLLRGEKNFKEHVDYKLHTVKRWLDNNPGHEVVLAIDDWLPLREAYEAEGFPTLIVHPGYGDGRMFK